MHEIDDTVRQTGLMDDAGQGKGQQRCVLGALPNAGVSAHDGRDHFPERHGRGEVAGVDDATNAEWASVGEEFLVGQF